MLDGTLAGTIFLLGPQDTTEFTPRTPGINARIHVYVDTQSPRKSTLLVVFLDAYYYSVRQDSRLLHIVDVLRCSTTEVGSKFSKASHSTLRSPKPHPTTHTSENTNCIPINNSTSHDYENLIFRNKMCTPTILG